jgi:hypothetical protein
MNTLSMVISHRPVHVVRVASRLLFVRLMTVIRLDTLLQRDRRLLSCCEAKKSASEMVVDWSRLLTRFLAFSKSFITL